MILLRIVAPKYKVLFRVPKDKNAVWCLMEKMHVLVSFRHELWCYWLSLQCWWITSVRACVLSRSVVSNSLRPHGLYVALQGPLSMEFPRQEVGCHFLLQRSFSTQGSNPHLLHWQAVSLPLHHLGSWINYTHTHTLSLSLSLSLSLTYIYFNNVHIK